MEDVDVGLGRLWTLDLTLDALGAGILEKLLSQENRVLEVWTARKKRLDQCQQFSVFSFSVRQVLEWLSTTGEAHLASPPIRDVKNLHKDLAFQWLDANRKFRDELKVRGPTSGGIIH